MKWGQRRARKQGKTYTYKSMVTKTFEKRSASQADKAKKAAAVGDTNKAKQHSIKANTNKRKANASREFDKKVLNAVNKEFKGAKGAAKYIALSPVGSKHYSELRASGEFSKRAAAGHSFLLNFGNVGLLTSAAISKNRATEPRAYYINENYHKKKYR